MASRCANVNDLFLGPDMASDRGARRVSPRRGEHEQPGAHQAENPRPQPDRALARQGGDRPESNPDLQQSDAVCKTMMPREELVGLVRFFVAFAFLLASGVLDVFLLRRVPLN